MKIRTVCFLLASIAWTGVPFDLSGQRATQPALRKSIPGALSIKADVNSSCTSALQTAASGAGAGRKVLGEQNPSVNAAAPLGKNSKLAGPISDIFNTPFAIITGTAATDAAMNDLCRRKSEALVAFCKQTHGQAPPVFRDSTVTDEDAAGYSLILLGGPDANLIARKMAGRIPLEISAGMIKIANRSFPVSDARVQMIYPNPLNGQRYVLIIAATSPEGMFFWTPDQLRSFQFDFTIMDGHVPNGSQQISAVDTGVAVGRFDQQWQVQDALIQPGNSEIRSRSTLLHAPKPGLKVDSKILDSYVGRYEISPGLAATIVRRGDHLMGQAGQGPEVELLPVSEAEFLVSEGPAQIVFLKDAAGKVVSFKRWQNGQEFIAGRIEKTTYTYKTVGDCRIQADVYHRPSNRPQPAILWLHGGALIWGSRTNLPVDQLKLYLQAGYTVVAVDYRLAPETKLPSIVEDIRDAYQWLRSQGPALFQIDPNRIAVIGHSAGGYLTLLSGVQFEPRPRALVSFYGYGDIAGAWSKQPSPYYSRQPAVPKDQAYQSVGNSVLTEGSYSKRFPYYLYCRQHALWTKEVAGVDLLEITFLKPYCPLRQAARDFPPALLIHGDQDTDVPFQQSVAMAQKLEELNVEHHLMLLPNRGHVFDTSGNGLKDPAISQVFNSVLQFLNNHLGK